MYCNYYGFKEKPFQITPNPRFLYLSRNHREAFAHLLYGINAHGGFIELTGEVGTGKTTVLRTLLEQLDDSTHRTALILNPCLSAPELLRSINREFGIPHEGLENGALLDELNRFLLRENREGRTVVLVIDEAQNLTPRVLEQIRLISNLETETDKLIQIVLAGQPELKALLKRPELRQLAQRITVSYHLLPMDYSDSIAYIRHRLQVAGTGRRVEFSPAALKRIFSFAKGAPRLINLACDRALLVGYGEGTGEITGKIAGVALAELGGKSEVAKRRKNWLLLTATLTSMVIIAIVTIFSPLSYAPGKRTLSAGMSESGKHTATELDSHPATAGEHPPPWRMLPEGPYPAVNAILSLWGRQGIPERDKRVSVATLVRNQGLSAISVTTLRDLVKLDTPAILEIMPDKAGKSRHIALTSVDGQTLRIAPELPGTPSITLGELAAVWTGRGVVVWKNRQKIPANFQQNAAGPGVLKLQRLLKGAGLFRGKHSGILDEATIEAVKTLQRTAGLRVDGIPDNRTLLVLYRDYGKERSPRLSSPGEKRS